VTPENTLIVSICTDSVSWKKYQNTVKQFLNWLVRRNAGAVPKMGGVSYAPAAECQDPDFLIGARNKKQRKKSLPLKLIFHY
jgi:hypothetical protein